ncbi:hypothetical protein CWB96_22485 [Pseudoalteromonas citrea]|uniref:Uncharacterized protein n=1 Tax=Pseudoalteromonas citrea TaxID=43655 RepID=A0A5S3XE43_9GAMM|nr:hypothetical protein CWB97_13430 [Pseudoalteromonas citrea]TMP51179.1 hypothetical protein CWB96_22485 [Pseudoalteromonas citrea]
MQYRKSAGKDFIDIVVDSTGLKVKVINKMTGLGMPKYQQQS